MKTMSPLRITHLVWITASIMALSGAQDISRIKDLGCVNDYDTKMVCFWEVVTGNANCSSDFQLKYANTDTENEVLYCKDLGNEYRENFRVANKCVCNIDVKNLISTDRYHVQVESQGRTEGEKTIAIFSSIKPKPPSLLEVDLSDPTNGVVKWKTNYENEYLATFLSYQIQFISVEDGKTVWEHPLEQMEPLRYKFNKRQLTRGSEYKVRVRTKHKQTQIIWSEWSPAYTFRNDYDLTIMDSIGIIIPIFCIFIILIIVSCYFCVTRTKKIWWNNIPDPAKSKLAESKLIQHNFVTPTGKPKTGKSFGSCLREMVKAHEKTTYNLITKNSPAKDYQNLTGHNTETIVFQPEIVDVERRVYLGPKEDNLYCEDLPEEKEEDLHLVYDSSIDGLLREMLCDSSAQMQPMGQLFGSFGTSFLRGNSQKTERHLPLSMVSQESGYQSYDSDDSPGDLKSDGSNPLYIDRALSPGDFLPYSPASGEIISQIGKDDVFISSGYNSFARALAEAASEGDNVSIFSLGTSFCKPYHPHSMQNPKSILYYNRHHVTTPYEGHRQPIMTPTFDHRMETCSSSGSEEPGYQSFNQAVNQGDTSRSTTCIVFDSGYKPFESLARTSTSSLENIGGSPQRENDLIQSNEDHLWDGMVNDETDHCNDSQSSGFFYNELNFYDKKYPSYSETLGDDHRNLVNQTSDNQYGMGKTLRDVDNPLALTFDISDHLKNFANLQGPKMPLRSQIIGLPQNVLSFSCSLDVAPIMYDENCLHPDKSFPMKFENLSYFAPIYHLRTKDDSQTSSHLLIQHNRMDEEGNSYMKIAV
ncbi:interleukin-4 receptor subunit alpha-like [Engystomops pustulosus]|uniref:interleukin-4 receptor subunit alpha-like n=1 Tax=Engystomops pustulosus TaxID=76066 RepID=UPI003AFA54B7